MGTTPGASAVLYAAAGVAVGFAALAYPARVEGKGSNVTAPPNEHFAITEPARLSPEDARLAYNSLADKMVRAYAASGDAVARHYRSWTLLNEAPYPSAAHGNRYVNNYANSLAAAAGYGTPGAEMPAGAAIAKDSFTATPSGRLYPGALFIMEKLKEAASPATSDWRYVMIMPDGSIFGDSAIDAAPMAFCHACHAARAADDYLFMLPSGR